MSFRSVRIGLATLIRGDAFEVLETLPDSSVAAVVTDPPFGAREFEGDLDRADGMSGGIWRHPPALGGIRRSPVPRFTVLSKNEIEELERRFVELSRLLRRVLRPGAHAVVASQSLLSPYVARALATSLEPRGTLVRLVRTLRGGDRPKGAEKEFPGVVSLPYGSYEPWVVVRRPLEGTLAENLRRYGVGGLRRGDPPIADVFESGRTPRREREAAGHPALKPQALLRRLVVSVLPLDRGFVLDPFAGSGSTLAAASAEGLPSVGIERDPKYFREALEAIPKLEAF